MEEILILFKVFNGLCLIEVSWGDNEWIDMSHMFEDCSELTTIETTEAPDLSKTHDISNMFEGATKFDDDISGWDVSNVKDMYNMFYEASSFDQDLSGWDVTNVVKMIGFAEGSALTCDHTPNFEDKSASGCK